MSAFLGPIHFWLYNKIQIQQDIVEEILRLSEDLQPGLREELDTKYGVSETKSLEKVIDEGNIHGWLQNQIAIIECKLAYSVTLLKEKNPDIITKIESIFKKKGKEKSESINTDNAAEAYKVINDSLLDGMPCDHANTVIEESEEKVVWRRSICVHKNYWEEVGGDINIYYSLREEFIKGMLIGTVLEYEKVDEVTNMIRR
ncbi:MAG: hypothetical protein LLF98_08365 [Clostridium sp.]|uniref:hypothetical protein n=1 Tax=Clostridium sp. TaxID=1506 RepID=UPI0025C507A2|nr:hypothetical protein [Clostridium sp.]MCE5221266.1 hypothetical protein [Clostridium sp.]